LSDALTSVVVTLLNEMLKEGSFHGGTHNKNRASGMDDSRQD
jgi:hypothetical protein